MAPLQDAAEKEQALKSALWYSVGQTIDSISLSKDINATPHFIGALSEMLWAQIGKPRRDKQKKNDSARSARTRNAEYVFVQLQKPSATI